MITAKTIETLENIDLPPHCACGDSVCDRCVDWRMSHDEREAINEAIQLTVRFHTYMRS